MAVRDLQALREVHVDTIREGPARVWTHNNGHSLEEWQQLMTSESGGQSLCQRVVGLRNAVTHLGRALRRLRLRQSGGADAPVEVMDGQEGEGRAEGRVVEAEAEAEAETEAEAEVADNVMMDTTRDATWDTTAHELSSRTHQGRAGGGVPGGSGVDAEAFLRRVSGSQFGHPSDATYSWFFCHVIIGALQPLASGTLAVPAALAPYGLQEEDWNLWTAAYRADFATRGVTLADARMGPTGYIPSDVQERLLWPTSLGGMSNVPLHIYGQLAAWAQSVTQSQNAALAAGQRRRP